MSDLIREIIPWTTLAWTQVHNGFLPLWNPYSALACPLAFNWQSATFSLPALLGYLVPVRFDFTVQVLVTLVVGGYRYLRPRTGHAPRRARCSHGGDRLRAQRIVLALSGWPIAR